MRGWRRSSPGSQDEGDEPRFHIPAADTKTMEMYTMKGIWFTSEGQAEFLDEPEPTCEEDTVLLRTIYSGLSNGTERNKLMGGNYSRGKYPDRIGYQHVSEVIECGEEITRFRKGDMVFTATFPGHVPFHVARESDLIVKLPDEMDKPAATLMGVASVSMHSVRRVDVNSDDRVLVFGAGPIGLFALQASVVTGAEVVVVDRNIDRLDLASELGAAEVHDNTEDAAWDLLGKGGKFSVCLECSGADVLDRIIGQTWGDGVLAKNARLVFIAGRFETAFNFNAASSCRLVTYSSAHFAQDDLEQVLRLAGEGKIHLEKLVRDIVPIEEAIGIYDTLRDDKSKLLGTVFDWRPERKNTHE